MSALSATKKRGKDQRRPQKGGRLGAIAPWIIIILGLFLLVRPIALQWIEAWEASKGIDAVVATYDEMSDPERAALRAEARAYNADLFKGLDLSGHLPYEQQLVFRGSEMIAYISIPKCSVRLPIYHGTEDKALMAGVGHLRNSSLPAGGESSHCVLTAHTGMPGRRMFDDIHVLEPGDQFVIWVLGEALCYEVYDSEVILPHETESLALQEGRDLVTLVTCTPYGINSHRLLVHAERCEYTEGAEEMADVAVYVNNRTLPFLIAAFFVLLLLLGLIWQRLRKWRERHEENRRRTDEAKDSKDDDETEADKDEDAAHSTSALCEHNLNVLHRIFKSFTLSFSLFSDLSKIRYVRILIKRLPCVDMLRTKSANEAGKNMRRRLTTDSAVCRMALSRPLVRALCLSSLLVLAPPQSAFAAETWEKMRAPLAISFDVQEDSNTRWKGIADFAIGQDMPFELIGTFPEDLDDREALEYWLVIDFPSSIDYQEGSVRAILHDEDENETDVTSLLASNFQSRELRIGSDDILAALPKLESSYKLALYCEGRLNERAGLGFENGNTVWGHIEYEGAELVTSETDLEHSSAVGSSQISHQLFGLASLLFPVAYAAQGKDLNRSVELPTTVYSYEVEIVKVGADTGAPLEGATFALRDSDGLWYVRESDWSKNQEEATTVVTNANGRALFRYVDSEYYELVELEAPEGYEVCDPVDITIETDVPEGSSATILEVSSRSAFAVNASSSAGHVNLSAWNNPAGSNAGANGTSNTSLEQTTNPQTSVPREAEAGTIIPNDLSHENANLAATDSSDVINIRQALSLTADESPQILPWLIISVLCLICGVVVRRTQKG